MLVRENKEDQISEGIIHVHGLKVNFVQMSILSKLI